MTLVEAVAEEELRQPRRVHHQVHRAVRAREVELVQVVETEVARDRLLEELRALVEVLGAPEVDAQIVERAVRG